MNTRKTFHSPVWTRVALGLILCLLLVLALLPVGLRLAAEDWLQKHGAEQATLEDVDLNLFDATLALRGVRLVAGGQTVLQARWLGLELDWLALLRHRIHLRLVSLRGLQLDLRRTADGELHLGELPLAALLGGGEDDAKTANATAATPWTFGIDGLQIDNLGLRYAQPQLQLDTRIDRLRLRDLYTWNPEHPAQLDLRARIDGAPLQLRSQLQPFAANTSPANPQFAGRLQLTRLALAPFAELLGAAGVERVAGRLSIDSRFALSDDQHALGLQQDGDIRLDGLDLATAGVTLTPQRLAWAGSIDLRRPAAGPLHLAGDGRLAADGVQAGLAARRLHVSARQLALPLRLVPGQAATEASGGLQIDDLAVRVDDYPLAAVQHLDIAGLRVAGGDDLQAAQIRLEQLSLAKHADAPLLAARRLDARQLALHGRRLSLETVDGRSVVVALHRNADGRLSLAPLRQALQRLAGEALPAAEAAPTTAPAANTPPATAAEPFRFRIDRLQLGEDSRLVFDDAAVQPPTRSELSLQRLNLAPLDNGAPDQASRFEADGRLDEHGRFRLDGELQPFAPALSGRLRAQIESLDLPRLSPYTQQSLGFLLQAGTLQADIETTIRRAQLDGEAKLTLYQLQLAPAEGQQGTGTVNAVSLNTSLDLLRDKHNTIRLKIPLSGSLNDPKFSFADAINQALMTATRKGALSYFLNALQPYGTLISVAQFAGEQLTRLRLDPVVFAPGGTDLDAQAQDYLQKVTGILRERPRVAVSLCGVAVPADLPQGAAETTPDKGLSAAQTSQLKALAQARADAVRAFLGEQVPEARPRLAGCLPKVDTAAEARPRVDLLV